MRASLAICVPACGWLRGGRTSKGSVLEPGGGAGSPLRIVGVCLGRVPPLPLLPGTTANT